MLAFSQDKLAKPASYIPSHIIDAFFGPLACIVDGLRRCKMFLWLQDKKLRYTTIRELDRLNDDYLDDIGIKKRSDIRPMVKALVKRRREGQYRSTWF